tara:strand:+ start:436 stop:687 length:252 start_codon:yes stop_codon:yes gene_type:complete
VRTNQVPHGLSKFRPGVDVLGDGHKAVFQGHKGILIAFNLQRGLLLPLEYLCNATKIVFCLYQCTQMIFEDGNLIDDNGPASD